MITSTFACGPRDRPTVMSVGGALARYGLVVVIAWFGALMFTAHEAQGIQPLVSPSPFMSWLYDFFNVTTFSSLAGVFELATALPANS